MKRAIALVGALATGAACEAGESPDGDDGGPIPTSSTTSVTTARTVTSDADAGGPSGSADGEVSTGAAATAGGASSATSGGATEAPGDTLAEGDTASTDTMGGGGSCDPDRQPNPCLSCVVQTCCGLVNICNDDPGCACVLDCHVTRGNSLGMCKSQCDHDGERYQDVFFCGQMSCLGTCDWDCC